MRLGRALLASTWALLGCATGTATYNEDPGVDSDVSDASAMADEGRPAVDSGKVTHPPDTGTSSDATATDATSGGDTGQDSATVSCTSPDQCNAGATSLGTVAGDESGPTKTASGATSEWLRFDLMEDDNSIIGHPMKLTATLTSPTGANFDLYAYLGSAIGSIDCTQVQAQSTNPAGQTDSVSFEWGETGGIANGVDDSATVMLEIRWVAGTCASSSSWSLSAHGD